MLCDYEGTLQICEYVLQLFVFRHYFSSSTRIRDRSSDRIYTVTEYRDIYILDSHRSLQLRTTVASCIGAPGSITPPPPRWREEEGISSIHACTRDS